MRQIVAGLVIALALHATPAHAQRANGDGLWFAGGVGGGWTRVGCQICQTDRGTDISGFLGLGGRFSSRVLVGAEATGWKRSHPNNDETLWGVSAVAYFLPAARRGVFWKAGAGIIAYRNADDQDALTTSALDLAVGAGYALPIRPRLSITPFVNLHLAALFGEVKFNNATIENQASVSLLQLGLGVLRR